MEFTDDHCAYQAENEGQLKTHHNYPHNSVPLIKKYPCEECNYQALRKSHLTRHQQSVHIGMKYPCGECDYQASQKSHITSHQQSVHMGKKYPCEKCDYQATQKSHIILHQKSVHMGQKYPCEKCDYQASTKSNLTRHQQSQKSHITSHQKSVHMGKKYPCEECDYMASHKSSLITHQKSVHMGKKYPCEECDYQATQKTHLNTHQKSVHMGKKYPCEKCDYLASHKSSLITHQKSVHMFHVSSEHDEKDKRKSTADNVVASQPSDVEYVNEMKEENINLKEENINLKEQLKILTSDSDTANIVLKNENIKLKEQVKNLTIDNATVYIKVYKLEEKLKGFTSQLVVKKEKMEHFQKRNERLSCENSTLTKEKETISSLNVKMKSTIDSLFGKEKIHLEKISDLEHSRNKSVARETVNVEVSPKQPVKSKPSKYGIHVLSEEAKVIKPAPKRSNLQTELTKCQMLNHRLQLENYQYWNVAQVVYGIFQQMGEEITARMNVSALSQHSSYLNMYKKFQECPEADVTVNLVWLIQNILTDIFTESFQETCIRMQSSIASIKNSVIVE